MKINPIKRSGLTLPEELKNVENLKIINNTDLLGMPDETGTHGTFDLSDFVVTANKRDLSLKGNNLDGLLKSWGGSIGDPTANGIIRPDADRNDANLYNRLTANEYFKESNFDSRLSYYMANSMTNFGLVDPFNKGQATSVYINSLLGNNDEEMKRVHNALKNDPNVYGTPAIMNPYSAIRLYGALELTDRGGNRVVNENYMIDRQRRRKFYDVASADNDETKTMASVPSTTNIIRWSTKDEWGRTPYRFQDFVFCKHWKTIENNRLITLRRYPNPTRDNLTFDHMFEDSGSTQKITFSPLSTMVTYFGDGTGNKLSDLIGFSCGYKWKDATSEMFRVTLANGAGNRNGNTNSKLSSGIDGLLFGNFSLEGGGGNAFTSIWGSIMNILNGNPEDVNEGSIYDNGKYPDPYQNGPWRNMLQGPVNSINNVKMRKEGLDFSQNISLTFKYVSRPIGGINTKAVLLDILSNALVMGYSSAVFWKGGHRFAIKPSLFKPTGIIADLIYDLNTSGDIDAAVDKLCELLTKMTSIPSITDMITRGATKVKDAVLGEIEDFRDRLEGEYDSIENQSGEDSARAIAEGAGIDSSKLSDNNLKKLTDAVGSIGGGLGSKFISGFLKYVMNMSGTLQYLQNYGALLNGDPVGDWHLTIGNPFNPIATIGNLIVSDMQVKFSDELGPDDFPLEMDVTYKLQHGMPRDSDAIQSMFNRGVGRIYTLPDWAKTSADYMTKVDKNIPDKMDGLTHHGWNQDKIQEMKQVFDPRDEEMNRRNGAGVYGGDVQQKVIVPSNSGSSVMNIPKYTPINYNQTMNLRYVVKDLSTATRGIFFIDDASKYATFTNRN